MVATGAQLTNAETRGGLWQSILHVQLGGVFHQNGRIDSTRLQLGTTLARHNETSGCVHFKDTLHKLSTSPEVVIYALTFCRAVPQFWGMLCPSGTSSCVTVTGIKRRRLQHQNRLLCPSS